MKDYQSAYYKRVTKPKRRLASESARVSMSYSIGEGQSRYRGDVQPITLNIPASLVTYIRSVISGERSAESTMTHWISAAIEERRERRVTYEIVPDMTGKKRRTTIELPIEQIEYLAEVCGVGSPTNSRSAWIIYAMYQKQARDQAAAAAKKKGR